MINLTCISQLATTDSHIDVDENSMVTRIRNRIDGTDEIYTIDGDGNRGTVCTGPLIDLSQFTTPDRQVVTAIYAEASSNLLIGRYVFGHHIYFTHTVFFSGVDFIDQSLIVELQAASAAARHRVQLPLFLLGDDRSHGVIAITQPDRIACER